MYVNHMDGTVLGTEVTGYYYHFCYSYAILFFFFWGGKVEEKWIIALEIKDFPMEEVMFVSIANIWSVIIWYLKYKIKSDDSIFNLKESYEI